MAPNIPIPCSPAPSAPAESQSFCSQNSDGAEFSFHADPSQDNVPSSSTADKFAHTRSKRKRTSREDFVVLEAEYQRNSRPDKAARGNIVKRVTLSEKELQIWFQNRRQMTRRKCRTWQPNEITSIIRSTQDSNGDGMPSDADNASSQENTTKPHEQRSSSQESSAPSTCSPLPSQDNVPYGNTSLRKGITPFELALVRAVESSFSGIDEDDDDNGDEADASSNALQASAAANGLSDNDGDRTSSAQPLELNDHPHNADESMVITNTQIMLGTAKNCPGENPAPTVQRKSSSMRLSMSLDGKAQVIMTGGTPSPPKKPQSPAISERAGPLQRSQSMISPSSRPASEIPDDMPAWKRPRPHGRSRDARAWEFYCDSDARNALTRTAEQDQKGSALGVIGLIRSGSGSRKPLTPVKRENSQLQRSHSSAKRKALGQHVMQKPKLARTASSVARLQTTIHSQITSNQGESKPGSKLALWREPSGDSDKENCDPENDGADHPHWGASSHGIAAGLQQRGVLQENTTVMSHASSLGAMMQKDCTLSKRRRKQVAVHDQENQENQGDTSDEEVSAFMGDARVPKAEDEMDAVQNLLSLSQGAWR